MLDDDMPEDIRMIRDTCAKLEENERVSKTVSGVLDTMLAQDMPVTFDWITTNIGGPLDQRAMFAAMIVREHNRRKVAALLEQAADGTAH